MKIAFTGGRNYDQYGLVTQIVCSFPAEVEFLVGDASGLDFLVRTVCRDFKRLHTVFIANLDKYGKAAGPIRNRAMLDDKPDLLIVFPGGKGTFDCMSQAKKMGIPVLRVDDKN